MGRQSPSSSNESTLFAALSLCLANTPCETDQERKPDENKHQNETKDFVDSVCSFDLGGLENDRAMAGVESQSSRAGVEVSSVHSGL
jgi:hypothetical protein